MKKIIAIVDKPISKSQTEAETRKFNRRRTYLSFIFSIVVHSFLAIALAVTDGGFSKTEKSRYPTEISTRSKRTDEKEIKLRTREELIVTAKDALLKSKANNAFVSKNFGKDIIEIEADAFRPTGSDPIGSTLLQEYIRTLDNDHAIINAALKGENNLFAQIYIILKAQLDLHGKTFAGKNHLLLDLLSSTGGDCQAIYKETIDSFINSGINKGDYILALEAYTDHFLPVLYNSKDGNIIAIDGSAKIRNEPQGDLYAVNILYLAYLKKLGIDCPVNSGDLLLKQAKDISGQAPPSIGLNNDMGSVLKIGRNAYSNTSTPDFAIRKVIPFGVMEGFAKNIQEVIEAASQSKEDEACPKKIKIGEQILEVYINAKQVNPVDFYDNSTIIGFNSKKKAIEFSTLSNDGQKTYLENIFYNTVQETISEKFIQRLFDIFNNPDSCNITHIMNVKICNDWEKVQDSFANLTRFLSILDGSINNNPYDFFERVDTKGKRIHNELNKEFYTYLDNCPKGHQLLQSLDKISSNISNNPSEFIKKLNKHHSPEKYSLISLTNYLFNLTGLFHDNHFNPFSLILKEITNPFILTDNNGNILSKPSKNRKLNENKDNKLYMSFGTSSQVTGYFNLPDTPKKQAEMLRLSVDTYHSLLFCLITQALPDNNTGLYFNNEFLLPKLANQFHFKQIPLFKTRFTNTITFGSYYLDNSKLSKSKKIDWVILNILRVKMNLPPIMSEQAFKEQFGKYGFEHVENYTPDPTTPSQTKK